MIYVYEININTCIIFTKYKLIGGGTLNVYYYFCYMIQMRRCCFDTFDSVLSQMIFARDIFNFDVRVHRGLSCR